MYVKKSATPHPKVTNFKVTKHQVLKKYLGNAVILTITLQIFWAKSSNPRVGGSEGGGGGRGCDGRREGRARAKPCNQCIFVLNHGPPLVYELSFTGTVRSQHLQEHSSGLRTSQSGQ